MANGKLLYTESSNPVLCDDLEGWGGWEVREVQEGGVACIPMADSCCGSAKTNTMP